MIDKKIVYPYIPNSVPEIKAQMMKEVGITDMMDLYEEVPDNLLLHRDMNLPEPILDEYSIRRHVEQLLKKNKNCSEYLSFLGAGCAQHFVPAVCDEINTRGEFLTAYTGRGYADHARYQAIFEYCSLMGELLDMDVLSFPLYDGSQAAATSLRMSSRITERNEFLLPRTMNPEILMVINTYMKRVIGPELTVKLLDFDPKTSLIDLDDLRSKISLRTAAVLIENPSYLGHFEIQAEQIGEISRKSGAEFVVYTDPISLGIIAPPAQYGATITCGDFQPLGMHMLCGGGQCGFIATHDDMRYVCEFKEKMFGLAKTTTEGEFGFREVLVERTSYGSRENSKEFTGTTTGLWAVTAAVYLSLLGPKGLEEIGNTIIQTSHYAAKRISEIKGIRCLSHTPFFKEFIVNFDGTGKSVHKINSALLRHKIFGGKDISAEFPEHGQSALYCVTEIMNREDIERLVTALKKVSV